MLRLSVLSLLSSILAYKIIEPDYSELYNKSYWMNWSPEDTYIDTIWSSRNGMITKNNETYHLKGINLSGFESEPCRVPLGMWDKPLSFFLDILKENGFNTVRLPLSLQIMDNLHLPIGNCVGAEPHFHSGQPVKEVLDTVLDELHQRNISVLIDMHNYYNKITPNPWNEDYDENAIIDVWLRFMKEYWNHPALFAIELKNEVWGGMTLDTWLRFVAKWTTNINKYFHHFQGLFFVGGVQIGSSPWGGSFSDPWALTSFEGLIHPSPLCAINSDVRRYVLSPHCYGTDVRGASVRFEDGNTWQQTYGFITELKSHFNVSPIVIGETGGFYRPYSFDKDYSDRWADWHLNTKHIKSGIFYWTLAPFSSDTGGLLNDDYTINYDKLRYINHFSSH